MIVLLTGVSEPGNPRVLANKLTLSQLEWADYAHHITNGTPGFSDGPG